MSTGRVETSSLLDWRSHTIARVVCSTFAGETMAAVEGFSAAIYTRAVWCECVTGQGAALLDEDLSEMAPVLGVTDCKSSFDTMQRDGVKLPSERRLGLELAALREILSSEADKNISPTTMGGMPLRWLPTEVQLADALTKNMSGEPLRKAITTGALQLTEGATDGETGKEPRCFLASSLRQVVEARLSSHPTKIGMRVNLWPFG